MQYVVSSFAAAVLACICTGFYFYLFSLGLLGLLGDGFFLLCLFSSCDACCLTFFWALSVTVGVSAQLRVVFLQQV